MNDWVRPAVFGGLNGLVTSATLILLLAGGGASRHAVTLGGAAVLLAGALAAGTGTCIAVTDQNERAGPGMPLPLLARFASAAEEELAGCFLRYGADHATAARMAAAVRADEQLAARLRAREKLGADPLELPSPFLSGLASAAAFAAGAVVPLLPYLAGKPDPTLVLALTAAAAALLYPWRARSRLMTMRWIWLVPSKMRTIVERGAFCAGHHGQYGRHGSSGPGREAHRG